MAAQADYVIAKCSLLEFCRERGLPHVSFRTFEEVTAHLGEWLERQERSPMTQLSPVSEGSLGRRS